MDIIFLKDIFLFFIAVLLVFYIPGIVILRQLNIDTGQIVSHFWAPVIGYVSFTFVYYVLSLANLRALVVLLLILVCICWLTQRRKLSILKPCFHFHNLLKIILFLILSLIFSLSVLRSGWVTTEGLQLVSVNAQDGVWNLALIEELRHQFPPQHPSFTGVMIKGYHVLYNLSLAGIVNLFQINSANLFFHFFPIFISFYWIGGVYILVKEITCSRLASWLAVFFTVFGGSFVFLIPSVWQRGISLDDGFGIQQPVSAMLNPTFAASVVLVIASLYFLMKYNRNKKAGWLILLTLFVGVSIGFKTYAGMILLGSLAVTSLLELIIKRQINLLISFLGAVLISLLVFLPLNANTGFLILLPLWPLERIMMGNFAYTEWDLKKMYYREIHNNLGLTKLWLWAFVVFFFGNLGVRLFAFLTFFKWLKKYNTSNYFFLGCLGVSGLVPLFFIQPAGGVFNMIQMYWYFLFFLAILTAVSVSFLVSKFPVRLKVVTIIILIIVTLPSAVEKQKGSLSGQARIIDHSQLEALQFLKNYQSYDLTVLNVPDLPKYDFDTLNGWFDSSVPIVTAFGGKRTYVGGEVVTFPYKEKDERLRAVSQFMQPENDCLVSVNGNTCNAGLINSRIILDKEKIALIYAPVKISWLSRISELTLIFNNKEYLVYRVNRID